MAPPFGRPLWQVSGVGVRDKLLETKLSVQKLRLKWICSWNLEHLK